jgi:hypothetical protein
MANMATTERTPTKGIEINANATKSITAAAPRTPERIAKTKNMRRYRDDSWLMSQATANQSPVLNSLLAGNLQEYFRI